MLSINTIARVIVNTVRTATNVTYTLLATTITEQ